MKTLNKEASKFKKDNLKYKKNHGKPQKESKAIRYIKYIFYVLNKAHVENLYINQEIGLLEPSYTAIIVPIVSTVTLTLVRIFGINPQNFYYKITPFYKELKFNFLFKAELSFRIINFIYSIMKDKSAQNITKKGG